MRIALISVHGDPNLQAGGKDAGGMNIYIREVVEKLSCSGFEVDVFTRDHDRKNEIETHFSKINIKYIKAGNNSLNKVGIYLTINFYNIFFFMIISCSEYFIYDISIVS